MNYYRDRAFDAESCRMSAEEGYAPAQYNLACFLSDENGGRQNWNEAVKWFGEAAAQGRAEAQHRMGECYYYGLGTEQDFEKAADWYKLAAIQGDADAQYKLGVCYELGHGVDRDEELAFLWYKKAVERDSADAMHALGCCYANGIGVRTNKLQAGFWFDKATGQVNKESDNPYSAEADKWVEYLLNDTKNADERGGDEDEGYALDLELYCLAQCYETGCVGVEQDLIEATKLYIQLSDSGGKLGEMAGRKIREYYEDGILFDGLLEKIESGDKSAPAVMDKLGDCYKHGFGVEQDWEKAVQLYRKAAEAGNAAAQRSLGYCYECGEGVEQDFVQAAFWYKKGAEGGDPDAQVNLANFYFGGKAWKMTIHRRSTGTQNLPNRSIRSHGDSLAAVMRPDRE